MGQCTWVPPFSCCPQHPGDTGIRAHLPFIADRQHQTPDPNAGTTGGSKAGSGQEGEHCLEKDSTRIQCIVLSSLYFL